MSAATAPTAVDLLVELDRLGVNVTLKGDWISLKPTSRIPDDLATILREQRADLAALLTDPRRRWKQQAVAILITVDDPDLREGLGHVFDEREAIASVDGGLDDDRAGQLAYRELAAWMAADINVNMKE